MTAPQLDLARPWSGATPPTGVRRLLSAAPAVRHADHLRRIGPLPHVALEPLLEMVSAVRLAGRGGGAFPVATKIAAVARAADRRRPVVVVNACEGDPTAAKDRTLLARSPHLVLDGARLVAGALRAVRVVVAVHAASGAALRVREAVRDSGIDSQIQIIEVPDRFVASEASSLVNLVNSGDARPLGRLAPIWESGIGGAPTLVSNAETFADLALLARFGPTWYASVGTAAEPGTTLVTLGGAVGSPGVLEVAFGTPVGAILSAAGARPHGFALVGGLAGGWVEVAEMGGTPYTSADLRAVGATRGVGSMVLLPADGCLLTETARITRYLANASAGQCGPCMFGLPAIAADFEALVAGDRQAAARLHRRLPVIRGRGGCAHPDGAVGLAASAMSWLTGSLRPHLDLHLSTGGCSAPPVLQLSGPR